MSKRELAKSFWVDDANRTGQARMELPLRLFGNIERVGNKSAQQSTPTNGKNVVSQFWWDAEAAAPADALSPLPTSEILPRVEDLYYLRMRAISQRIVEGYWLDYTRPGVLEDSVALLDGQRLCTDHNYWNVRDAIGAIVATEWDAKGENSNNFPGINVRFFVDAKRAPEIVRMLAWPVPGIHSCSVTVGFEWEPSHPDLLEDGDFWRLRGREYEGQIVRMIVTKILFYRELSLVYEGADADAKRLPDEDEADDTNELGRKTKMNSAEPPALTSASIKEKTVKLSKEQKELLGLSHAGDDVPDADVVSALDTLQKSQAAQSAEVKAAQAIIATERAEVVRLATLAEAGEDGKLPEVIATSIEHTPADKLSALKAHYEQKAASKLGVKNGTARSSVEDNPVTAPQQPKAATTDVSFL